jgi:tetratricopeptide (TPR) repeat protein
MRKFAVLFATLLAAAGSAHAAGISYCGELKNHYGPLDYRKRGQVNLEIVEEAHFTAQVEAGVSGATGYLGNDIDYTLRAIPNHPRALATLAKIALRDKVVFVPNTKWPVECYFDRARRFAPDDAAPVAVHANYLFSLGKFDKAREVFQQAYNLDPVNPTINYNLGLLYLKEKQYDKALEHAHKAYSKGFPLAGLKNKLVEAGKWKEPPAPAAADNEPKPEPTTETKPAEQAAKAN